MPHQSALHEEILAAWIELTTILNNDRLVSDLTFNESLILRFLQERSEPLTATQLCQQMKMKKSQMNRTLTVLEEKELILRQRSSEDKRKINVLLLEEGRRRFNCQHQKILELIDAFIRSIGFEKAVQLKELFELLSHIAEKEISRSNQ